MFQPQPPYGTVTTTTFWTTPSPPLWLPQGFQVPPHLFTNRQAWLMEAQTVYYQFDRDRNGVLKKKEFKRAMEALGIHKHQAKHLFKMMDRDHNHVITMDEFINAFLFLQCGGMGMMQQQPMMMMGQPSMYPPPSQLPYGQTMYPPQQGYPGYGQPGPFQ